MGIKIDTEDVANGLMSLIDASVKNRKDLVRFLSEFIIDNDRATEYFVKMAMGSSYPTLPAKGAFGYIKLSDHSYTVSSQLKEAMEESDLNRHGFYPCTVVSCGAIHNYSPLLIEFHISGDDIKINVNISYDKFYPAESVDIYDDLPI